MRPSVSSPALRNKGNLSIEDINEYHFDLMSGKISLKAQ
jgi:hypothetical protein